MAPNCPWATPITPWLLGAGLRPSGLVSLLLVVMPRTELNGCPLAAGLDGAAGLASVAVASMADVSPVELGPVATDDVPGPGDSPRSRKRRSAAARLSMYCAANWCLGSIRICSMCDSSPAYINRLAHRYFSLPS